MPQLLASSFCSFSHSFKLMLFFNECKNLFYSFIQLWIFCVIKSPSHILTSDKGKMHNIHHRFNIYTKSVFKEDLSRCRGVFERGTRTNYPITQDPLLGRANKISGHKGVFYL